MSEASKWTEAKIREQIDREFETAKFYAGTIQTVEAVNRIEQAFEYLLELLDRQNERIDAIEANYKAEIEGVERWVQSWMEKEDEK